MTTAPAPLLHRDLRRLGRILGDAVRIQHGKAAFELIERIRRLSTALRNSG